MKDSTEPMAESSFDSLMEEATQSGVLNSVENAHESDKDSDLGSDSDSSEATTLKMLFHKFQEGGNFDLIDACQQAGLLASSAACCHCHAPMSLTPLNCLDAVGWRCESCGHFRNIREGSWLEDCRDIQLKDIITVMYCWSWNYPAELCQHELDLKQPPSLVQRLYKKCQLLAKEFARSEYSNLGTRNGAAVQIDQFSDQSGHHIFGGVEVNNGRNTFFKILPDSWTRDDLISCLIDHVAQGALVLCPGKLASYIDAVAIKYLRKVWNIKVELNTAGDNSNVISSIFSLYKEGQTNNNSKSKECDIAEFVFRRKLKHKKDPFLYLINVASNLYPPSTSQNSLCA